MRNLFYSLNINYLLTNLRNFFLSTHSLPIVVIFVIFVILQLVVITWGIPNASHPFTYHMDEWHQLSSVRELANLRSSNTSGAANGTVLHFLQAVAYLALLFIIHIVNPFDIQSSVTQLNIQEKLFIFLRLNTLFFWNG